jgi:hypothetical protein
MENISRGNMRILCLNQTNKKKVRGLKKKCQSMIRELKALTDQFPLQDSTEDYWHIHLPVAQSFIDSKNTPRSVRRLCMQTMINRAAFLSQNKPESEAACHVCCLISLPELWASEITIFYTQSYFQDFFERNSMYEKWTLIKNRDFAKEHKILIPTNFQVKGYKVECFDDDDPSILTYTGEIWYIGEQ